MKQSRIDILVQIHAQDERYGEPLLVDPYADDVSPDNCLTLQRDIEYLLRQGYIVEDERSPNTVYYLWLTEKGESFVRAGCQDTHSTQQSSVMNIDLSGAQFSNAMIGSTIAGSKIAMNDGASLAELKELISHKAAQDQADLAELVHQLECLQNADETIQRGCLSRFSDLVKKHTDLIAPLATTVLQILLGS